MRVHRNIRLVVLGTALVAAACGGDARLDQVQPGIERDSVVQLLTQQAVGDSAPLNLDSLTNIWRSTPYFVNGQNVEIVFYSPSGEKRTPTDTVPENEIVPVVIIDGKVVGYGRSALNDLYSRYPLPKNRY